MFNQKLLLVNLTSYLHIICTDPIPVTLILSNETDGLSKNISWSPLPLSEDDQVYNVTVRDSERNMVTSSQLDERYLVLNATDNVPTCEVYNFSVTATYVGATYVGGGCSIPSNEVFMLPSLPDIWELEKYLKNHLIKESTEITLSISFEVRCYIH